MRKHAPRVMFELVPLLQKIIPTMVADLLDELPVRDGDFMDMRRVDDEFASIGDDWFELIHSLASNPKVVIHRRHL